MQRLQKLRQRFKVVVCVVVLFILAIALTIIIRGYEGLTTGLKCIRDQFLFVILLCARLSVTVYLCKNVYLVVDKVELWG